MHKLIFRDDKLSKVCHSIITTTTTTHNNRHNDTETDVDSLARVPSGSNYAKANQFNCMGEGERGELKGMTMGLYFKNYISFGPVVYS